MGHYNVTKLGKQERITDGIWARVAVTEEEIQESVMLWGWYKHSGSRKKEWWTVPDDGHKLSEMRSKNWSFIESVERVQQPKMQWYLDASSQGMLKSWRTMPGMIQGSDIELGAKRELLQCL